MDVWSITREGYDPAETVANGSRFLLANGAMGVRGTADEAGAAELAAVNLAGVYDRRGDKWRESVNAPNPLFAKLYVDGAPAALGEAEVLSHTLTLALRRGVLYRDTTFPGARVQSERLVSMAEPHLLAARLTLTFPRDAAAELVTGVSADIWDINGPHLFDFVYDAGAVLSAHAHTGEGNIPVAAAQSVRCDFPCAETRAVTDKGVFRRIRFAARAGERYTVSLFGAVTTGLDGGAPDERARALCERAAAAGFAAALSAHEATWAAIWRRSAVELTGCGEAARALNVSLYHLNSIAPRRARALSIPARGLSGQTYKGAVFWDSEIFLVPFFVHTQPELARSLLRYRIETLGGARQKAAEYGCRGAFYAWESQEGGAEACSDYNVTDVFTHRPVRTYFRDKQIHISADVSYALWRYYEITGDKSLLREGGAEVILECARFYLSRACRRADGARAELWDVLGPDEYHERVNNNAFTNQMAAHCMDCALALADVFRDEPELLPGLLDKLGYARDWQLLEDVAPRLRPAFAEGALIEQFDGYFKLEDCTLDEVRARVLDPREYWGADRGVAAQTQIIKQADVIAMAALFPELLSQETLRRNYDYYAPRTEHGSSLSACMYALAACRLGRPELAWEHFMKSASIDLVGGGKQWAGEVYIGGTHPAANGGAWMIAALGFAGLRVERGALSCAPCLPEQVTSLRFPVALGARRVTVTVTREGWSAE